MVLFFVFKFDKTDKLIIWSGNCSECIAMKIENWQFILVEKNHNITFVYAAKILKTSLIISDP